MQNLRFTNAGRDLLTRALRGEQIVFTKMMIGSGELGEADYKQLNALIDPKITLSLFRIQVKDGEAIVTGEFSNIRQTEGFYYRELGLFARDPDDPDKEILYGYINFGAQCQYITEPAAALITRTVRIYAVVDDAPNVTAILNEHADYVERQELMQILEEHNMSESAHPNLIDFDVTVFVNPATEDVEETRDGTLEHPYISIQEAVEKLPPSSLRVQIYLQRGGVYYPGPDTSVVLRALQKISITALVTAPRPIITGGLAFADCGTVEISGVEFVAPGAAQTNPRTTAMTFVRCSRCVLSRITGTTLEDSKPFLVADASAVTCSDVTTLNAYKSFVAQNGGSIYAAASCSISGGSIGMHALSGGEIRYAARMQNTATMPKLTDDTSLVWDENTANDISAGRVHAHLNDTDSNPHQVSLTQAQTKGGMIDTAHGGTGRTEYTEGALIKAGAKILEQLLGQGALFAQAYGEPRFGVLPIQWGGTGQSRPEYKYSDTAEYGAHSGYWIVPGTNGLMFAFGRIRIEANLPFSYDFSLKFDGYEMTDNEYTLVFTNDDIETSKVTKYADRFEIASSVAGRAADFILIGRATKNGGTVYAQEGTE